MNTTNTNAAIIAEIFKEVDSYAGSSSDNHCQFITQINSCKIYLGSSHTARSVPYLKQNNIRAILTCADDVKLPAEVIDHVLYLHLMIKDSSQFDITPFFEQAHKFIAQCVTLGLNILIHCSAGVSRSATIVISYLLVAYENYTLADAWLHVKRKRKYVYPNKRFAHALVNFERKLRPTQALSVTHDYVELLHSDKSVLQW